MPFDFTIEQHIATLSEKGGYSFELNRVAYRDYPAKLDLRKWKDGQPMKGITLTDDEARSLLTALEGVFDGQE